MKGRSEQASTEWLSEDEMPDWLKKCLKCHHVYKKKSDDETIYCRKRNGKCEFKEYKPKSK